MIVIIVFDIGLFESFFGKMNLFFKIILFYGSIVLFLLLIILINTASSVSFEAKKSYNLLNKLFITITNNKQIGIRIKIKVYILTINLVFILMHFLIIFFLSQYSYSCYHLLKESQRKRLDFIVGKYLFSTIFVYMK